MDQFTIVPYSVSPSTIQVIRSNRIPHAEEVEEISQSIDAAQSVRTGLASQITAAQLALLQLQRLDDNAMQHIRRCTGALSPIRRLPPEVLSRIFHFYHQNCFSSVSTFGREPLFHSDRIWTLGEICSYWRSVAVTTGHLWSTFQFTCKGRPQKTEAALAWLLRAGNYPLTFSFACAGHGSAVVDCDVFKALLSRGDRWRNAVFTIPQFFLPAVGALKGRLPILEKLHYTNGSQSAPPIPLLDAFSVAPMLHDLSLSDILASVPAILPWDQIEHYSGDQFDNMRNHVLGIAPNINTFVLNSPHGPAVTAVTHQLKKLDFRSGYHTLACLTLPALKILHFRGVDSTHITRLLTRSGTALTDLHIESFDLALHNILDVFEITPALTSLTLLANRATFQATGAANDYIFIRLTPKRFRAARTGTWPVLLPRLQRLTATGLPASDAFVHMLESRVVATDENVRLESVLLRDVVVVPSEHAYSYARLQELANLTGMAVAIHGIVHPLRRSGV
ncbi:hypothetical protein C8F04DRAFT_1088595 [Mycena alexandri]|uniref:F-box domain-containing protein n=1 Tax=Mycena alexandri TaxID=1745969 RepID=A0AAD6X4L2_9AGAR|nr:hypothetical protein C8F04DRAFT_1088595 [Mycena alexandri]